MVFWYIFALPVAKFPNIYSKYSFPLIYCTLHALNILCCIHHLDVLGSTNPIFTVRNGWERFSGFRPRTEDTCKQAPTISTFSIRANREGMSAVCRVPSSVVQAAKAGMKTWWTALTTRSDGSASDSSISSKPWNTHTRESDKKDEHEAFTEKAMLTPEASLFLQLT